MKSFKKIMALVIAMMMVLVTAMPAFADDTTPKHNLTLDNAISITALEAGDKVDFYQILEFNQDATTTGGWVATAAFKYDATTNPNGLKESDIQKMLSLDPNGVYSSAITDAGISSTLAARLADIAEAASVTAKYSQIEASGSGTSKTASVSNPAGGLYMALVTPGTSSTTYNPMFVGADYNSTDNTHTWAVSISPSYSPTSIAKKSSITLNKTASTTEAAYEDGQPETVAVGDTVTFTVETTIPTYGDNYTDAVFNVIDTLTQGLELKTNTINVFEGWGASKTALNASGTTSGDNPTSFTNYTIKDKALDHAITSTDKTGYGVQFDTSYILGTGRGKNITITYDAVVTTDAPFSVNLEKNTVEVHFSNSPTDSTGAGRLKDETKHYTFDIDADILGATPGTWPTTEVVKVGLDKEGKEIYEVTTTLHQGQTQVGALEGATFKLYTVDSNGSLTIKDKSDTEIKLTQYTNTILTSSSKIVSDSTGRLTIQGQDKPGIRGLDIGAYYLVEETAPDGYIRYQKAVKVEIIAPKPTGGATYNDYWELKEYSDELDGQTVKWNVWELKKYDVKIDGVQTASYTFENSSSDNSASNYDDGDVISTKTDTVTGSDLAGLIGHEAATAAAGYGKITNTQGVELPSTGGIGTTIFYVIGVILVLAAGILLVTRRRMNAK